ncbi:ComEC/Rec2 family competence protein [Halalkalibacterium ligniniphilum]|uniref:ComEC/Rec2 family competence protein n=1 Tax=Halalkalibacterium ligniniphilum TaxID=1134413 RepID=UPI00034D7081|nr:ComEC/Rec2 family competence protein [Halalkalibacterium ligniniphilum]
MSFEILLMQLIYLFYMISGVRSNYRTFILILLLSAAFVGSAGNLTNAASLTRASDTEEVEQSDLENKREVTAAVKSDELANAKFVFFDVGQGNSTLIVGPNKEVILIDTGRYDNYLIFKLLKQEEVEKIDLLILTHPHADHIGNAESIIQSYAPQEIWMNGDKHTSHVFERVMNAVHESKTGYHVPSIGKSYKIGAFTLKLLHSSCGSNDLNNGSMAFYLSYGQVTIFFTGDIEKAAEQAIINGGLVQRVDILQVPHHASSDSSHDFFLRRFNPSVAIYSAAEMNSYGHPHKEALTRLKKVAKKVYGTDMNGTIKIMTNGVNYEVVVERSEERKVMPSKII